MLRRPVRRRGRARGRTVWRWLSTSGDGKAGKPARGKDGCVLPPILKRTASTEDVGRLGESVVVIAVSSHAISANMASRGAAHRANSVRMRSIAASDSVARAADSCRRCTSAASAANTFSWRRCTSASVANTSSRRRCTSASAANNASWQHCISASAATTSSWRRCTSASAANNASWRQRSSTSARAADSAVRRSSAACFSRAAAA